MKKKRVNKFRRFLIGCCAILAVFIAGAIFAYLNLASLLQEYGVPIVSEYAPVSTLKVKINRADLEGLRLSALSVSKGGVSGIELDGATLSMNSAKVAKLELNGLKISPILRDGMFMIPGLKTARKEMRNKTTTKRDSKSASGSHFQIPFVADKAQIRIKRSEILFASVENGAKRISKIPYSLSVDRDGDSAKLAVCLGPIDIQFRGISVKIPKMTVHGDAKLAGDAAICHIAAGFADASLSKGKLRITGIRGNLPISFVIENDTIKFKSAKLANRSDSGAIFAEKILLDDQNVANMAISYKRSQTIDDGERDVAKKAPTTLKGQSNGDFLISGKINSPMLGKQSVTISGTCSPPDGGNGLAANLAATLKLDDLSSVLASFPALEEWSAKGGLDAGVSAKFARRVLSTSARLQLKGVSAANKKAGISIEKLGMDFIIDDCLALRSRPSQKLEFENLKLGDFILDNGAVTFQIESIKSMLVERVELGWCDGNVDVNAFRIMLDNPENIDATLYCDRLHVAKLLNQMNIGQAKGDGNVSGRIPASYANGEITINDGFLYSTPGVGGRLALTDFMGPLESLPTTIQLQITQEALKDFNYDWIKLKLNSQDKDLLLGVSLKGAPAGPMPFVYDNKNGGVRKSDNSNSKANFQGITFDLNFKLPANQLIKVGKNIKGMME